MAMALLKGIWFTDTESVFNKKQTFQKHDQFSDFLPTPLMGKHLSF